MCRNPQFMVSLFVMHISPLMNHCSTVCNTGYIGDPRLLEAVQRRWTKNEEGFADLDYASRLRQLELFSVRGKLLRSDLIKYWKVIHGWNEEVDFEGIFQLAPDRRTRGHAYKLLMPACSTDIKKRMFGARCVQRWNSLPSFVVEADGLTTFKRLLTDVLGDALYEFL